MTTSLITRSLAVMAAAALTGMLAFGALAQEKKATTTPPKTEKTAKTPSPCKGLDETTCKGKTECGWVAESKDKATGNVKKKAYCRAKPKPKAKTDAK